jgi:hypothetical protein
MSRYASIYNMIIIFFQSIYIDYSQRLLDRLGGKTFLFDCGVRLVHHNSAGNDISIWNLSQHDSMCIDNEHKEQDGTWFEQMLNNDDEVHYDAILSKRWSYIKDGNYSFEDLSSDQVKYEIQNAVNNVTNSLDETGNCLSYKNRT